MINRLFALLLVLVTVLSIAPSVFAEETHLSEKPELLEDGTVLTEDFLSEEVVLNADAGITEDVLEETPDLPGTNTASELESLAPSSDDTVLEEAEKSEPNEPVRALQNGWVRDGDYWCYYNNGLLYRNGRYIIDGDYYAFDKDGHMVTGWYKQTAGDYETFWYYFDSNGKGYNGWLELGKNKYYCKDSWAYSGTIFVIDGASYAFDDNCRMQTGWYKYRFINGNYQWCYFDTDGKGHNGWVKDSKNWY